jgi:hypothetical protein
MDTKEFCGAARPFKELKRKGGNPYYPLNALEKFMVDLVVRKRTWSQTMNIQFHKRSFANDIRKN